MKLELTKDFTFEASHILPKHPGKCSRLHGHSWVLRVSVFGQINPETGFVQDYAEIKEAVQPLVNYLDHRHLGTTLALGTPDEIGGLTPNFYPSSENLIVWIAETLVSRGFRWSKLEIDETCTSKCVLTIEEYNGVQR